jgi:hypothetical protein
MDTCASSNVKGQNNASNAKRSKTQDQGAGVNELLGLHDGVINYRAVQLMSECLHSN